MNSTPISLREKNYDPDQFVSVLAHEVRNPLSNINLSVEALESTITNGDSKIYFDIIKRSSVRINDIIIELLKSHVVHKEKGHKYSIHHLLDDVIEMEQDRISLKNILVKKEYASQDREIALDKPKMKIALTNIIINAIDAMTPQNGQLTLTTKSNNGIPVIEIKDNGCGISKQNLKNIFMPDYSHKPGGLGIGLASTLHLLKLNHVGIEVESEEGSGTCFILSFCKYKQPGKLKYLNGKKSQRKLQTLSVEASMLSQQHIQN